MQKTTKQRKSDPEHQEENVPDLGHETGGMANVLLVLWYFCKCEENLFVFKYPLSLGMAEKLSNTYNKNKYGLKF